MRVAVIGGGVVGLTCAYELARAGADVTVLERGKIGRGASLGNTGWVCPSFSYPLPGPGIIGEGLRGMLRRGGPLALRPSVDPTFLRWLLRFRRSASRERWEEGVKALIGLNERTLELFDAYASDGIEFEMHMSGLVLVATTANGLRAYLDIFRGLRALGYRGEISELGPGDARGLEPSLSSRIAGGVHARVDRYVRPESLTAGLAAHLSAHGVEIQEDVDVSDPAGLDADSVVVAAGASSPPLLARLGIRMPLVGARGYSFTFAGGATQPSHALYLAEAKVGISSYDESVRVAGVFELGRADDQLDSMRVQAMLSTVEPYFEDWRPAEEQPLGEWAGLRPMTADGLPLIGRSPAFEHVFVATGHGMLGVTLAPATAALLTQLLLEGRSASQLVPFDPARR